MNEADLLKIAEEAGFAIFHGIIGATKWGEWIQINDELKRFAELVAKRERETCANLCEQLPPPISCSGAEKSLWDVATMACAQGIRTQKSIAHDEWVQPFFARRSAHNTGANYQHQAHHRAKQDAWLLRPPAIMRSNDVFDSDYCLDAPDLIPTGRTMWFHSVPCQRVGFFMRDKDE